jgi:hypothetical protein
MLRRGGRITAALNGKYIQQDQAHGKPFHPVDLSVLYENLEHVALKNGDFDESADAFAKGRGWRLSRICSSILPPRSAGRTIHTTPRSS